MPDRAACNRPDSDADFTTANYIRLMRLAAERYEFCTFNDFKGRDHFAISRHDVDMSPHRALAFARAENVIGIRATYFLNIHSEYYNLFEPTTSQIIRQIVDLGHCLGLHFDHLACGCTSEKDAVQVMRKERKMLESYFNAHVRTFSFHLTDAFSYGADKESYAGMQNATSRYFRKHVKYCSDSTGVWRYDRLEDAISYGGYKRLQVLTHPCMWQDDPMPPMERYKRCIYGRADSNWARTQELLSIYGTGLGAKQTDGGL